MMKSVSGFRVGEVHFQVWPQDHEPRHVHAFVGSGEVIIDLLADGTVDLADRPDAVRGNIKRSEIRKVLQAADRHFHALAAKWDEMHDGQDR
jgi:hypothetical protein